MYRLFSTLVLVLLLVSACGGDDDSTDDSPPAATEANLTPGEPTITSTVDTSRELPPETTVDPSVRLDPDQIDAVPTQPRTPTIAIEGQATLPPSVVIATSTSLPTNTREPSPEPTATPRESPTPTEPVAVGSCDGFGYDESIIAERSEIEREQPFELGWTAPDDAQNVSYEIRVFNSQSGQIFQSATTATSFTVPERVTTNRLADGFLQWQVDVLSNGTSLGCDPITGEAEFTSP